MVAKLIISNSGNIDDAKDVFQEAILVFIKKLKDEEFTLNSKLRTYLYAICRNLWLKKLQRTSAYTHTHDVHDFEEKFTVEDDIEYKELEDKQFALMETALNQLGEPCQTIIRDFYIRSMSMAAICDKFGYTNPENAKNQKYKCLQRLKKIYFSKD